MHIFGIIRVDNETIATVLFDLACTDFDSTSSFFGGVFLLKAINFLKQSV